MCLHKNKDISEDSFYDVNIKFKDGIPVGFPEDAYTLAINYPEQFATRYVSNGEYAPESEDN